MRSFHNGSGVYNRLLYSLQHNVCTTKEQNTSLRKSMKIVSDHTAEDEEEEELRSQKESMVVRKPIN